MTRNYEAEYRALREGLEALAHELWLERDTPSGPDSWYSGIIHARNALNAVLAPSPAEGTGETVCICDGAAYEPKRQPFLVHPGCPIHTPAPVSSGEEGEPVIPGYTLAELDRLHSHVGLGPTWQASARRAELADPVTPSAEVSS